MTSTPSVSGPRRLLRRLRDVMAGHGRAQDRLDQVVRIIAADMVASAYEAGERSAIAFGASARWIIVAAVPVGIGLLCASVCLRMLRCVLFLLGGADDPHAPARSESRPVNDALRPTHGS